MARGGGCTEDEWHIQTQEARNAYISRHNISVTEGELSKQHNQFTGVGVRGLTLVLVMDTILEQQRRYHEERERLMAAMVKECLHKKNSVRQQ